MNADRPDPSRPEDPDHGLDFDAAFADIVARLGPLEQDETEDEKAEEKAEEKAGTAQPDECEVQPAPGPEAGHEPAPDPAQDAAADRGPRPDPAAASWADEGHFVPPEPPPLPAVEPRRRAAWVALLGSPVLAFLLAIVGSGVPGWVGLLLAAAFVGGFGYLVATMRSSPPDDWSDDGARL